MKMAVVSLHELAVLRRALNGCGDVDYKRNDECKLQPSAGVQDQWHGGTVHGQREHVSVSARAARRPRREQRAELGRQRETQRGRSIDEDLHFSRNILCALCW